MAGLFLSYRLLFLLLFLEQVSWSEIWIILFRGWKFDTLTICNLFLPLWFLLTIALWSDKRSQIFFKFALAYFFATCILSLLITFSNFLHYAYLHRLMTYQIWHQLNDWAIVGKMLYEEPALLWALIGGMGLLFAGGVLIWFLIFHLSMVVACPRKKRLHLIYFPFCIWGALGNCSLLDGKVLPFQIGDAYFSSRIELNEAILNPVYVLIRTTYDHFFQEEYPLLNYTKMKQPVESIIQEQKSPFRNVVLIIMEGMQASFVNDSILAPFLYQLKEHSLCFTRAYSAGIHTAHAVFSLHTGLPAQCTHPFWGQIPHKYASSLPDMLKKNGFHSFFMMPHNRKFDNMEGFLFLNGFDRVYAQDDYPDNKTVNVFGVNDEYLLKQAILYIRKWENDAPLFCTLLTVSNHIPYTIPNNFPRKGMERKYRIVQYADWALSAFFLQAEREEWFDRTLFVLVGDHAREYSGVGQYEVEAHHVACYFYAPGHIVPEVRKDLMGHVDVAPTIMGYLGIPVPTTMYGIDIRSRKRDFLVMSADDGVECIDTFHYYRYRNKDNECGITYNRMRTISTKNSIEKVRNYLHSLLCDKEKAN